MKKNVLFFIFSSLAIISLSTSCGYVGNPVAPELLTPSSVKNIQASFVNDKLNLSWLAPDSKKNGEDINVKQLIAYELYEANINDDIISEKVKFKNFLKIATVKTKANEAGRVQYSLSDLELNQRKALVVVPVFLNQDSELYKSSEYSVEPGIKGAVVDCITYYAVKDNLTNTLKTDVRVQLLDTIYGRPSYFGI